MSASHDEVFDALRQYADFMDEDHDADKLNRAADILRKANITSARDVKAHLMKIGGIDKVFKPKKQRAKKRGKPDVVPTPRFMAKLFDAIEPYDNDPSQKFLDSLARHLLSSNPQLSPDSLADMFSDREAYDKVLADMQSGEPDSKRARTAIVALPPMEIARRGYDASKKQYYDAVFFNFVRKFAMDYGEADPVLNSDRTKFNPTDGNQNYVVLPINAISAGWILNEADYFVFDNLGGKLEQLVADNIHVILLLRPDMAYVLTTPEKKIFYEPAVLAWDLVRCGIVLPKNDIAVSQAILDAFESIFTSGTLGTGALKDESQSVSVLGMVRMARENHSGRVPQQPVLRGTVFKSESHKNEDSDSSESDGDDNYIDFDNSDGRMEAAFFWDIITKAAETKNIYGATWWYKGNVKTTQELTAALTKMGRRVQKDTLLYMFAEIDAGWAWDNSNPVREAVSLALEEVVIWPEHVENTIFYFYVHTPRSFFPREMVEFYEYAAIGRGQQWLDNVVKAWVDIAFIIEKQAADSKQLYRSLLEYIGDVQADGAQERIRSAMDALNNSLISEDGTTTIRAIGSIREDRKGKRARELLGDHNIGLWSYIWHPPVPMYPFTNIPTMAKGTDPSRVLITGNGVVAQRLLGGASKQEALEFHPAPLMIDYHQDEVDLPQKPVTEGLGRGEMWTFLVRKWYPTLEPDSRLFIDVLRLARKAGVDVLSYASEQVDNLLPEVGKPAKDAKGYLAHRLIDFEGVATDAWERDNLSGMYTAASLHFDSPDNSESEATVESSSEESDSNSDDEVDIFGELIDSLGEDFEDEEPLAIYLEITLSDNGEPHADHLPPVTFYELESKLNIDPYTSIDAGKILTAAEVPDDAVIRLKVAMAARIPDMVYEARRVVLKKRFAQQTRYYFITDGVSSSIDIAPRTTVRSAMRSATLEDVNEGTMTHDQLSMAMSLYVLAHHDWVAFEQVIVDQTAIRDARKHLQHTIRVKPSALDFERQVIAEAAHMADMSCYTPTHAGFLTIFLGEKSKMGDDAIALDSSSEDEEEYFIKSDEDDIESYESDDDLMLDAAGRMGALVIK